MKSRKPGSSKNFESFRRALSLKKSVLRKQFFEELEDRRLMSVTPINGKYYPPVGIYSGDFVSMEARQEYIRLSKIQYGGSYNRGSGGEGAGDFFSTIESEPNNSARTANPLPLGTAAGKYPVVTVSGILPKPGIRMPSDFDYYSFELRAGDILDVSIDGAESTDAGGVWDISLGTSTGTEIMGSDNADVGDAYPISSPLSKPYSTSGGVQTNLDAVLAHVIPSNGTYTLRVAGGYGAYTLKLSVFRPVMESTTIGTKQILFLDFDGEVLDTNVFDVPGFTRLSPLVDFLPDWGLQDTDESAVIDSIVAAVTENFVGSLPATGGNGHYTVTGIAGQFDLEIRNSRDHEDPWGLPNVSRLIIGGTSAELGIPGIRGIAQSVDIGNFDTAETAVILLDTFSDPDPNNPDSINSFTLDPNSTIIDAIGRTVGATSSHEAGHFFGAWHTDNANSALQLIDTGGMDLATTRGGVGLDGIFGTADDIDIDFGTDRYSPSENYTGRQNSAAHMAFSLSTGTIGGAISGTQFNDRNRNGRRDSGEEGLGSFTVYVDANRNGTLDSSEPRTTTAVDGSFNLNAPAGTHYIRVVQPSGWTQTTPSTGFLTATVTNNKRVTGLTFGSFQPSASVTGTVWNDANGNALRETTEGPMAGVWVYLDLDGDDRIDLNEPSAISKADGSYSLPFPGPGTYTIREVLEPGYVQTYPGKNTQEHVVTFDGSTPVSGMDFGNQVSRDYGDAPNTYGTLITASGAYHGLLNGFRLGTRWDSDGDGQPTVLANGDDIAGLTDSTGKVIDDEDGVVLPRPMISGTSDNILKVTATNTTATTGYVQAWVDFNADGDFTDAGEQIVKDRLLVTGTHLISFAVPANAQLGSSYARVRYSDQLGLGPSGPARIGEVEDYYFKVSNTLDLAVDDSFSVLRNSTNNPLDVLANDYHVEGETLTVSSLNTVNTVGTVTISADSKSVIYTPRPGFVGYDTFVYEMSNTNGDKDVATVTVLVESPVAVDDSFKDALSNSSATVLPNVMANDYTGATGSIRLVSVTQPASGSVVINNGGTPNNPLDDRIVYTPVSGFNGTTQFTYTIADSRNLTSTATVTVQVGNSAADDEVGLKLTVTDMNGQPIDDVTVGSDFKVRGTVQDLRSVGNPFGVFAAFQDVLFSKTLATPVALSYLSNPLGFNVTFGPLYPNQPTGDILVPGIINEIGSVQQGLDALGNGELLQFEIVFRANSLGKAEFIGDPADISPLHDTLIYENDTVVPFNRVRFGYDSVNIVSTSGGSGEGYTNGSNRYDVNNDGYTNSIDALGLINSLNGSGPRSLGGSGEGEGGDKRWFPDVNGDGYLTSSDVLAVINELNRRSSGPNAEGEGEGLDELAPLAFVTTANSSASPVTSTTVDTNTVVVRRARIALTPSVNVANVANLSLEDYLAAQAVSDERNSEEDWLGDLASDVAKHWLS